MRNRKYHKNLDESMYLKYGLQSDSGNKEDRMSDMIPMLSEFDPDNFNKTNKRARYATIQVTEDCNLRCSYCYQINKSKKMIDFETGKKFIDILLSRNDPKNTYLSESDGRFIILDFIGGEPLLAIDMIDQLTDYFVKRCIELDHPWLRTYTVSICTNGTLYFDPRVQRYMNKHKNNINVSITLDGDKELHDSCRVFPDGSGSYDIVMKAIDHYQKNFLGGRSMPSKLTICPENVGHLSTAIINLFEHGFDFVFENCVYEDVWNKESARTLYFELKKIADYLVDNDLYRKHSITMFKDRNFSPLDEQSNQNWCGGDGSMLAVAPDGKMYNCLRYMPSSLGNEREALCIGDVDSGIGVKEEHKCNICFMRRINRRSQEDDKCFFCPIGSGCGWCSGYNYQITGDPNNHVQTICDCHAAASLAAAYFWNRILIKNNETERYRFFTPKEWALPIIGEDEYNILIEMAGCEEIHEKEWYDKHAYPVWVDKNNTCHITADVPVDKDMEYTVESTTLDEYRKTFKSTDPGSIKLLSERKENKF